MIKILDSDWLHAIPPTITAQFGVNKHISNFVVFEILTYFKDNKIALVLHEIKVLCEQTRELTHDFLDYV